MNYCGEVGGQTASGEPCKQGTAPGKRCVWHPDVSAEQAAAQRSAVAKLGGLAAALPNTLPLDTVRLRFGDADACKAALEQNAHEVRTGLLAPDRGRVVVESVKAAIALGHLMLAARIAKLEEQLS